MAAQGLFVRYQHLTLSGIGRDGNYVRMNAAKAWQYVGPFANEDRAFSALRQLRDSKLFTKLDVVLRRDRSEQPIHIKPDPRTILGPAFYARRERGRLVNMNGAR